MDIIEHFEQFSTSYAFMVKFRPILKTLLTIYDKFMHLWTKFGLL